MKTLYVLFIVLFLNSIAILAQQPCGIYRTATDYEAQQISIPANCQFGKKAIQISDFFLHPYVYIKTKQGKIKFHEDSIYAIRNCDGNIYRICKQRAYQLSDTGKLQIYSYTYLGTVKVKTSKGSRREEKEKWMIDYYFSVDASTVPLAPENKQPQAIFT
jgi:hypothetical protein